MFPDAPTNPFQPRGAAAKSFFTQAAAESLEELVLNVDSVLNILPLDLFSTKVLFTRFFSQIVYRGLSSYLSTASSNEPSIPVSIQHRNIILSNNTSHSRPGFLRERALPRRAVRRTH